LNFEDKQRTGKIPAHVEGTLTKILNSKSFGRNEIAEPENTEVAANQEIMMPENSMQIFSNRV